jgi:hypothetical protein
VTLHSVHAGRNEDRRRDIAGMTTTLSCLRADEVNAGGQCLSNLLNYFNTKFREG